jgi:hypothetical protein
VGRHKSQVLIQKFKFRRKMRKMRKSRRSRRKSSPMVPKKMDRPVMRALCTISASISRRTLTSVKKLLQ